MIVTQFGAETTKLLGQSHSSDLNPHPELLHKGMPIWRTPGRGFPSSLPALTPAGVPYLRVRKQGMIKKRWGRRQRIEERREKRERERKRGRERQIYRELCNCLNILVGLLPKCVTVHKSTNQCFTNYSNGRGTGQELIAIV